MALTLLMVLGEIVQKKNQALMRGGWNFTNRTYMIRNWEMYN